MAEDGNVHPGSFVGDSVEEFRKLPTWGKVVVGLLFIGVAYLGYRSYAASKSNIGQASPGVDTTGGAALGQGGGAGIQTVPGGNTGTVPIFNTPEQPIYNPTTGELEGFQPVATTTSTGTTGTTGTTTTGTTGTTTTTTGTTGNGTLRGSPIVQKPVVTQPGGKNGTTKVPSQTMRFVTVTKFPSQYGTLSGIAQANNVPLSQVEKLNPQIKNPNLIYPGQKVRVA